MAADFGLLAGDRPGTGDQEKRKNDGGDCHDPVALVPQAHVFHSYVLNVCCLSVPIFVGLVPKNGHPNDSFAHVKPSYA